MFVPLVYLSHSLHLTGPEIFHLFLFRAWRVFSVVWTLFQKPQERRVLTEALAIVKRWTAWRDRAGHPAGAQKVLDGSCWVALTMLGAQYLCWLLVLTPVWGSSERNLHEKAQLALKWHFLRQPWYSTTFTYPGLEDEMRLLLTQFPGCTVGLESYVNWSLNRHIFGKSTPHTPADGWHTCLPELQFKKQSAL